MSYPQNEVPEEDQPVSGRNGCTCSILFTLLLILLAAAYVCLTSGVLPGLIGTGPAANPANEGAQNEGKAGTTGADGAATGPTSTEENSQPADPEENADTPPTAEPQNTPTPPAGSGQTLNANANTTFQAAQSCANDVGYPLEVQDHWDVWELIFYTIQYSTGNNELPQTCRQFAQFNSQNGLGDFIQVIGGEGWESGLAETNTIDTTCTDLADCAASCATTLGLGTANYSDFELAEYLAETYPDSSTRPADCRAFQSHLIQQEAQNALGDQSETVSTCESSSVPSALCQQGYNRGVANTCADKLAWNGDLNAASSIDLLSTYVTDQFSLRYGDIPNECYQFVHAESLAQTTRKAALANINASAACIENAAECRPLPAFGTISQSAVNCALDVQWNKPLETTNDLSEFFSYLIITAPWLDSGALPDACLDFLNSTSPTALSSEYWQLLAASLSQYDSAGR
ncbi:MAG: hypothetical protein JXB38_07270 [Anaerolineales bacterium]|nr:hypothetical protein [Anaerolineales bacterium]